MGGGFIGNPYIYVGMGIVLHRLDQCPTPGANKFDPSITIDPAHRSLLGALVGAKTEEIIKRGA